MFAMNYRMPNLQSKQDIKHVTTLINKMKLNMSELLTVSGPKGRFGICNQNVSNMVNKFGGLLIAGVMIDISDNVVYAQWHAIWKWKPSK